MGSGAARTKLLQDRHGGKQQKVNRRAQALEREVEDLKLKLVTAEESLDSAPAIFHEVARASALGFLGRLWWGLRFAWRGHVA